MTDEAEGKAGGRPDDEEDTSGNDHPTVADMYSDPSGDVDATGGLETPVGETESEPETISSVFYVKYATDSSVTLHDIDSEQICTLIENPGVENHDILDATIVAQPPMEVSYFVDELHDHYSIPVEISSEPPTSNVRELATDMDEMDAVAIEREGEGEIHILRVDPENVETTTEELLEDEMTYKNAARYDVGRVEIRSDEEKGIVSIRYLP